ncbi:hypothetical protein [Candidatus Fukatsuia endosymbiont of Tuberolachnus salignus]|uniref:hypothetical protein n=1 Tax=Candidatus Fukatsuia endosymbiont of Tuberolachnus salignus TaxID=3077957 RepID=UPI00313C64DD
MEKKYLFISCVIFYYLSVLASSTYLNVDKEIYFFIRIFIFINFIIIVFLSGCNVLISSFIMLPFLIFFSMISKNTYFIHFYVLFIFCLIFIFHHEKLTLKNCFIPIWLGSLLGLFTLLGLYFTGFSDNVVYAFAGVKKNSLGFSNPNTIGLIAAGIVIIGYYINRKIAFLSLLLFFCIYLQVFSRTSLILISIFYFYQFVFKKLSDKFIRIGIMLIIFLSFLLISILVTDNGFYFSLLLDFPVFIKLDEVLSSRLSFACEYILGKNLLFPSISQTNQDFSWANLVTMLGGLFLYLILALQFALMFRVERKFLSFYFLCLLLTFSSLFAENIVYSYFPLGLFSAFPYALMFYYFSKDLSKFIINKAVQ